MRFSTVCKIVQIFLLVFTERPTPSDGSSPLRATFTPADSFYRQSLFIVQESGNSVPHDSSSSSPPSSSNSIKSTSDSLTTKSDSSHVRTSNSPSSGGVIVGGGVSVGGRDPASFHCPDQFGYFADAHDCARYYVCVFGEALHETCTGGLYFSTELQTCDWPQNVRCEHTHTAQSTEPSPTPITTPISSFINNHHIHSSPTSSSSSSSSPNRDPSSILIIPNGSPTSTPSTLSWRPLYNRQRTRIAPSSSGATISTTTPKTTTMTTETLASTTTTSAPTESGSGLTEPITELSGNDLDGSEYEESIASFVDQNGEVFVDDGPGTVYSTRPGKQAKLNTQTIDTPTKNSQQPSSLTETTVLSVKEKQKNKPASGSSLTKNSPPSTGNGNESTNNNNNRTPRCYGDCDNKSDSESIKNYDPKRFRLSESLPPIHQQKARQNIVKKQLKTPEIEFFNKVIDDDEDDDEADSSSSSNVRNAQRVRSVDKQETLPVVTFVAPKQNIWALNKPKTTGLKLSMSPSLELNNLRNSESGSLNFNKFRRAEKSYTLSDESLMQIFRGTGNSALTLPGKVNANGNGNSQYLLQSYQSFPLPFPTNLVKPWQYSPSGAVSTSASAATHPYHYNLHQPTPSRKPGQQQLNESKIFTLNSAEKQQPQTEIHIFYSYRGDNGNNQSLPGSNRNAGNFRFPVHQTAGFEKAQPVTSNNNNIKILSGRIMNRSKVNNTFFDSNVASVSETRPLSGGQAVTNSTRKSQMATSKPEIDNDVSSDENLISSFGRSLSGPIESGMNFISGHGVTGSGVEKAPKPIYSNCDSNLNCKLPKCFCAGRSATLFPFATSQTPQMIVLTFDDAVNDINFPLYEEIFHDSERKRLNPNGCPIKGTFFVSHEWTDYGAVQTLYSRGHEIASHSITNRYGEKFTTDEWRREIDGQRRILERFAGIAPGDIRGMRAPFLQVGGDAQFQMLLDRNFTYDSSIAIFENDPPFWPYTMDFALQHDCMISPCPTRSYPGLWEIGLTMWQDLVGGGRCTMGNSCTSPPDEQGVFELIMSNFKRHYNTNRAPFGLYYQSGWFAAPHHKAGFLRFIDEVLRLGDVYFVTNWQMLQWMQKPTDLKNLDSFSKWHCPNSATPTSSSSTSTPSSASSNSSSSASPPSSSPPLISTRRHTAECPMPNICHVKFRRQNSVTSRFFKTCQPCPREYPWVDNVDALLG